MAKKKYQKMWEALATVFYIDPGSILPITISLPKVASYADKNWFFYSQSDGVGGAYYEEGEMEKAKIAGLKDFLDDNYREKYFQTVIEILKEDYSPLNKIESSNLKEVSDDDLKGLIIKGEEYLVEVFGYYLACQPQCVAGIEQKIQEDLAKFVPQELVVEIFTLLSTPTRTTSLRQEELDWLALLISAKKENLDIDDNKIQEGLKTHHRKYHLLHLGDGAEVSSLGHFINKFKEDERLSLDDLVAKLKMVEQSPIKIELDKKRVIDKYRLSEEIIKLADILAEIGHWRLEMRIQGWSPVQYYHQVLVREAGRRLGISDNKIEYATYHEVLDLFAGKKIDLELLQARSDCYLFAIEDGKTKLYAGQEAENKFNQLVEKIDLTKIREFKGNVAMRGRVAGRALVFRWGDDMEAKMKLIKDDTVLIAGQTRPQLMPLISKSKAIVTDEGGITSHAAIVSRELGIPCIIGTKIATQVLKDGDLVEVDAEKGVVKIIKLAND